MTQRPNKKIILIILFAMALVAIPGLIFSVKYVRDLRSGASTNIPPKSVVVLNSVGNSVDIAWVTDLPSVGKVRFAKTGGLPIESVDVRGEAYSGLSHLVKLRGLDPKTSYTYTVVSENTEFNSGTLVTLSSILTEPATILGTAKNGDLSALKDRLIRGILIEKGSGNEVSSTTIGTVTADNGSWTIDAGNFRTTAGEKIASFANYLLQVELIDKDGRIIARVITANIGTINPIALITGMVDDPSKVAATFTLATERVTPTPTTASVAIVTDGPTTTAKPVTTKSPTPTFVQVAAAKVSNAQIVNVLDGTFTIIWETDIPTNSYVKYTINGKNLSTAFDKRSNERSSRSLRSHFVEITDTTNSAGAKYDITLVNNSVEWKDKVAFQKINLDETPAIDSIKVQFDKAGNYIDQILLASIPNKTNSIAVTPNLLGTGILDLSSLRKMNNLSSKYSLASTDTLTFTLLGGTLKNKSDLDVENINTLRTTIDPLIISTTPKDLVPFKIIYINIKDGEVIKEAAPIFSGEGFKPDSDLQIEIQKQ